MLDNYEKYWKMDENIKKIIKCTKNVEKNLSQFDL